jgi:hypothetical protein
MKQQIVSAAHQFSVHHFTDVNLDQQEFASRIDNQLVQFTDIEDKIDFISEIIRLGKEMLNTSVQHLSLIEQTGIHPFGFMKVPQNYN